MKYLRYLNLLNPFFLFGFVLSFVWESMIAGGEYHERRRHR